jgi:hypothetical protein
MSSREQVFNRQMTGVTYDLALAVRRCRRAAWGAGAYLPFAHYRACSRTVLMSDAVPRAGDDRNPDGDLIEMQRIGLPPAEGEAGHSLDLTRWNAAMRDLRGALGIDEG